MTQRVSEQRLAGSLYQPRRRIQLRTPATPRVAVVVASRSDPAFLRPALPALMLQCSQLRAELVVVRAGATHEPSHLGADFPLLRLMETHSECDLQEMRARGLAEASSDITVLLDDRLPPACWERRLAGVQAKFGAPSVASGPAPLFSVVVAVNQAGGGLCRTLEALERSDLSRELWELIVVDDASTDDTAIAGARFADVLVQLPGGLPFGPAYARNRGAELARGDIVVFMDPDVRVRPDTLRSFRAAFSEVPHASAVIGCYDGMAGAPDVVSQYRNLLHHYTHQQNAGVTDAFWGGCGAVRRLAFLEAGGYDEWSFARPQVEDVEFGYRLKSAGRTIVLRPEIQATHMKRWTLSDLIATDIWDRGVPWVRVVSERAAESANVVIGTRTMERVNTILAWIGAVAAIVGVATRDTGWVWLFGTCLTGIVINNRRKLAFFRRARGVRFTAASIALDWLCYLVSGVAALAGWLLRETVGEPRPDPVTQAYSEVGAKQWPPVRKKPAASQLGALAGEARKN